MTEKGMKSIDLAGILKVQPPAISRWLRGTKPSFKHGVSIAKALNVNVHWLINGDERSRYVTDKGPMHEGTCDAEPSDASLHEEIRQQLTEHSMTPEERGHYQELRRLRSEINQRLVAAVTDPGDANRSRLQRRVDEYIELCRSLRPHVAKAVKDHFTSNPMT